MPRSRSRSPPSKRDRRRSRSRSRDRRHRKKRSRSRSPRHRASSPRHRSRSNSPRRRSPTPPKRSKEIENSKSDKKNSTASDATAVDETKLAGLDEEQLNMMKLMGFANFDSSKGKKVEGNDVSAVNLQRKRRYRQYMNRRGGFNRPLDFVA
ncbi:U4/U6.U5 small nuclear ribonucleoprotein 27 kDa protein-like isoform X1 [Biomphalaria pfeifferi]|uniref:U4/U6.U5 small nuclear ribonucleoprotein 27 kDa protein n=1 Tax=Biomphalaria pfeifferi TaxID=112525 RepID=A0AAD8BHG1_BIOPF|nr:U4/U6.U5 small nuclear ribonucleoprotein 27 kDa protein-like isoform X1 [Biomphalaria pfeifferi]